MNFIYDIILNFHNNFYEFYDWNKSDQLTTIRKIPIFGISTKKLNEIKNNKIKFDNDFLESIKNKTEYYSNRSIKNLEYCFLLTDFYEVIAINIEGKIKYSSLQVDEELDILEESHIKEINLKYDLIKKNKNNFLKTRNFILKEKFIKKELKKLEKEKDLDKIRYLYFECFNKKETDIEKILKKLNNSLDEKNVFIKLNKFFNTLTFN